MALTLAEFQEKFASANNGNQKLALFVEILKNPEHLRNEDFEVIYTAAETIKTYEQNAKFIKAIPELFPPYLAERTLDHTATAFSGVIAYAIGEIILKQEQRYAEEWFYKSLDDKFLIAVHSLIQFYVRNDSYKNALSIVEKLNEYLSSFLYTRYSHFLPGTPENMKKGIELLKERAERGVYNPLIIEELIGIISEYLPDATEIKQRLEAFKNKYAETDITEEQSEELVTEYDQIHEALNALYFSNDPHRNPQAAMVLFQLSQRGLIMSEKNHYLLEPSSDAWSFTYLAVAKTYDPQYQDTYEQALSSFSSNPQKVLDLFLMLPFELNLSTRFDLKADFIANALKNRNLGLAIALKQGRNELDQRHHSFDAELGWNSHLSIEDKLIYRLHALALITHDISDNKITSDYINVFSRKVPNNGFQLRVIASEYLGKLEAFLKENKANLSIESLKLIEPILIELKSTYVENTHKESSKRLEIFEQIQNCMDITRKQLEVLQPPTPEATTTASASTKKVAPEPQAPEALDVQQDVTPDTDGPTAEAGSSKDMWAILLEMLGKGPKKDIELTRPSTSSTPT